MKKWRQKWKMKKWKRKWSRNDKENDLKNEDEKNNDKNMIKEMVNAMMIKMIKKMKYFKDFQCVAGSILHNTIRHFSSKCWASWSSLCLRLWQSPFAGPIEAFCRASFFTWPTRQTLQRASLFLPAHQPWLPLAFWHLEATAEPVVGGSLLFCWLGSRSQQLWVSCSSQAQADVASSFGSCHHQCWYCLGQWTLSQCPRLALSQGPKEAWPSLPQTWKSLKKASSWC